MSRTTAETRVNGTAKQAEETLASRAQVPMSKNDQLPAVSSVATQLTELSTSCVAVTPTVLSELIQAAEQNGATLSVIETITITTEE